ncbi:hypothetical protein [Streptomyces sp. NPDC056796]|uniref:hypothetical protein n=1 Tax=Streptomyces sp. NPDC056796 TaxID=3345947 RepID=UPI003679FB85
MDLDRKTLEEAAVEALERPSNAHFYDDRLFTTHGRVFAWAEQSDDVLDESNYLSALALIKGAAGDDADECVIDGTEKHFAHGYQRTLYVQVYETYEEECECEPTFEHEDGCDRDEEAYYCQNFCLIECDGEQCLPEELEFTDAFIKATKLALYLQDCAVLDESDLSERERKRFEENVQRALDDAQGGYAWDTFEERTEIQNRTFQASELSELMGYEANAEVSWEKVAEIYADYRDTYFEELAVEVYRWNVLGYHPDQLEFSFAV